MTPSIAEVRPVAKSKDGPGGHVSKQINIRVPPKTFERLSGIAEALGLDLANAIRLVIAKGLPVVEEEVRDLKGRASPSD